MPLTAEQLGRIQAAFRPHAPIEDPASFFGRDREKSRVQEAISEPGLHVIVYGGPGCGKTSLANVATEGVPRVKVFCEKESDFGRILRDTALELQKRDPQRIVYDAAKDTITTAGTVLPLGKMSGNNLLTLLPTNTPLCVIFDELDRVSDSKAIGAVAELVKNVATNRPNLLSSWSVWRIRRARCSRAMPQIFAIFEKCSWTEWTKTDCAVYLSHGAQVVGVRFSEDVVAQIIQVCDGMPYYLHLLAKHAARVAIEVGSPVVELDDLARAATEAAEDADQQLRKTYDHAILSKEGSRIYQRILWAMANLSPAANNVAAICAEANRIAIGESDVAVTPQVIGTALKQLASEKKGGIVYPPIPRVYRFKSPLMKGFIRLVRRRR